MVRTRQRTDGCHRPVWVESRGNVDQYTLSGSDMEPEDSVFCCIGRGCRQLECSVYSKGSEK